MSDNAREKFLKHLRKQMKHGLCAGERVSAQKLYAQMMGAGTDSGEFGIDENGKVIANRQPSELQPMLPATPDISEYAQEAHRAVSQPRSELNCILGLIQPERWMKGLWGNIADGWRDKRSGTDLTFDEARVWIADRIAELGLDPEKVYAYPQSHSSIAEFTAFINTSFEERMERFRP